MSSPTTIALAGAERSILGDGPPAVPSRISLERCEDADLPERVSSAAAAERRTPNEASIAAERPAARNKRLRVGLNSISGCVCTRTFYASFLYLTRCGAAASSPRRRFLSASYSL